MGSTLTVDNIVGATTAGNVKLPAGCVLQTVQDVHTGATAQAAAGSLSYVTQQSVTITPKYNTSKILIRVCYSWGDSKGAGGGLTPRLQRGSTTIADFNAYWADGVNVSVYSSAIHEFLDSPATTSATTYNFQMANQGGVDILYYNPEYTGHTSQISTITVMEIAQ